MSHQTTVKKTRPIRCTVTSDKMDKSRVGMVERLVKHPRYGKVRKRRTKIMFHDEGNTTHLGDIVLIEPSRPMSARKKYKLLQLVLKAKE